MNWDQNNWNAEPGALFGDRYEPECRECGASEGLYLTDLFAPPLCSKCRAYQLEEDLIDIATTKLPELRKALHELADAVIQDVDIKDRSQRLQEAMLNAVSTLSKVAK